MDIPVNAEVICEDGQFGRSTYIILNPTTEKVTHIVVEGHNFPHAEILVPIGWIKDSTSDQIRLNCKQEKLSQLDPFYENDFIPSDLYEEGEFPYLMWPFVAPVSGFIPLEKDHIPAGELAIHRGTPVNAVDGQVGRVDEFLVDPQTGDITHLILREGHLWGQKDIAIPVGEIRDIEDEAVSLKMTKAEIEKLPVIPIHRQNTQPKA